MENSNIVKTISVVILIIVISLIIIPLRQIEPFSIIAVVIIFFIVGRLFTKGGHLSNDYRRIYLWYSKKIGNIDKTWTTSKLRSSLDNLYYHESKRVDPKRLAGFRRYIDTNAYANVLKK